MRVGPACSPTRPHQEVGRAGSPRTRAALLVALGCLGTACGFWQEPAVDSPASAQVRRREGPDDSDLAALVPTGMETVIEVDMAALRRSPWTSAALPQPDARLRQQKAEALGYDVTDDVDQIIYAVTEAGSGLPTLVIARGHVKTANVEAGFRARWPNVTVDAWRGLTILSSGENALASLSPRAFVSGPPDRVRAVIDRAFGVGIDVADDGVAGPGRAPGRGPLRRALLGGAGRAAPALLVTVALGPAIRARIGQAFPLPPELTQLGARLDVGETLDVEAVGVLTSRESAEELARRLGWILAAPGPRRTLAFLGLGDLLRGVRVAAEGARVRARTSVAAEQRETVAAALRAIVSALRTGGDPSVAGSW